MLCLCICKHHFWFDLSSLLLFKNVQKCISVIRLQKGSISINVQDQIILIPFCAMVKRAFPKIRFDNKIVQ